MGHQAHSTDVCASREEAVVLGLIERAIAAALAQIRAELREDIESIEDHMFSWDSLTVRVEACKQGRVDSSVMTTLKVNCFGLKKDLDGLKSTDLSMLFGIVEIPDIPSTDVPASSEVPPATSTRDVVMD
ncbi:uncharacterized protein LOC125827777 [Solanum verrucosum]|uniref:uncharacterized protein LOC125827777 n=1 Tax=Solanum verrucosum TaxID=315347 RepID=UPI0020D0015E|nr:uncharacterized protein LOC125827777 [Solanum verrucosum]